jgi:hypothetical protein
MNKQLNPGFTQVCTWPGTVLAADEVPDFEQFFKDEMSVRVQFLESVTTTGGRIDVLFAVHDEDVGKFAIPRLSMGIRWLEDVYGNGHGNQYPEHVAGYKCWAEDAA